MGSGCIVSGGSGSLFQKPIPDTTVKYTGDAIPALGICTGDTLSEVEAVILQKLIDFSEGKGIHIADIDLTLCDLFKDYITCCNDCDDLECLMQIVFKSLCFLYNEITDLSTLVDDLLNGPYDIGCLNVSGSAPLNTIIQELILEFCVLKTQVATLTTTVTNLSAAIPVTIGNFLLSHITSCQPSSVVKTGSGSSASIALKGFPPIGSIIPYGGPMNVFDASGLGLANTEACGWALANGNNGTWNMIGQVAVGMTNGMGGSIPSNATGSSYSMGDLVGEIKHLLTSAEAATQPHTHPISDPGHFHHLHFWYGSAGGGQNGNTYMKGDAGSLETPDPLGFNPGPPPISAYIDKRTTGIAVSNSLASNASQSHENRQPSRALAHIQRIA